MQEDKEVKTENKHGANRVALIVILAIAIVAAVAFLVWPKIEGQAEKPSPTFTVWHSYPSGSPQAEYIEQTALPQIEKQYVGVKASSVYYDESAMSSAVLSARNEGAAPDVLFLPPDAMAGLAQLGALAQLDGDDGLAGLSDIRTALSDGDTAAGMIGGKVYGLPVDMSVEVLLYNPSMLSAAGALPPSGLDSFWNMLGTLSSASGSAGFILPDAGMKSLAPFVWSSGGELVSADGSTASDYLNDSKNTAIFDNFSAAIENGGIVVADGKDDAFSRFASGGAAMTIADSSDLAAFTAQYPDFEFKVAAFPSGTAGSVSVLDCKYISVTADARKDAASSFLSGLAGAGVMETGIAAGIPQAAYSSARTLPMTGSMGDMQNEFLLAMKQITDGYQTTQEALDDLAMKWDAYLH